MDPKESLKRQLRVLKAKVGEQTFIEVANEVALEKAHIPGPTRTGAPGTSRVEPAASSLPKLLPANLISDVGSAESHNRDSGSDPHYYDINEFVNLPSSSDSESG